MEVRTIVATLVSAVVVSALIVLPAGSAGGQPVAAASAKAKPKPKTCKKGYVRKYVRIKRGTRRKLVAVCVRKPRRKLPASNGGPTVATVQRILSDYYKVQKTPTGGGPQDVTITFLRPTKVGPKGELDTTPGINDRGIPAWPAAVWLRTQNGHPEEDSHLGCAAPMSRFPGNAVAHWFYRSSAGGWEFRTNTPPTPGFCR